MHTLETMTSTGRPAETRTIIGRPAQAQTIGVLQRVLRPRARGPEPERQEAELSDFFAAYVDAGRPGVRHYLRHPRATARAVQALLAQPRLTARLGAGREAEAVATGLTHKTGIGRTVLHTASSVLELPKEAGAYASGAGRQTLRRKSRAAERAGVRWAEVTDPAERLELVRLSSARERIHPQAQYRWVDAENSHLLDHRLWLAAYGTDDEPLMLSVTPVEGEWALLRYFRTLTDSDAASNARYLMTGVLVEQLVGRGVRYLTDGTSPIGLPNGLRHFQRMLGWRIYPVRVVRTGRVEARELAEPVLVGAGTSSRP